MIQREFDGLKKVQKKALVCIYTKNTHDVECDGNYCISVGCDTDFL